VREDHFQDDATTRSVLTDKLLEIKVNAALTEHLGIEMANHYCIDSQWHDRS
jgi:hypothetical protein